MFTTHPNFKFPIQYDKNTPNWTAVELALNTPWLIAELEQEGCERFVFCDGPAQVSLFIDKAPLGRLNGLLLVLTPNWSETGEWQVTRIARVERDSRSRQAAPYSLVFLTVDGARYSGSPLEPFEGDNDGCVTVRELRVEPRAFQSYSDIDGEG